MGLKNRLSKMKNFLFDEEEVKEEKKDTKKDKKARQQELEEAFKEEPVTSSTNEYEFDYEKSVDDYDDYGSFDAQDEVVVEKTRSSKQEFTIPELTDDDFLFPQSEPRVEPEPIYNEPVLYQASKKRKEEVRRFRPSPNISPVYGLLDENGNTIDDNKDVVDIALNNKDEVSLDAVRKKAYGKLDDEFDNTLSDLKEKTVGEAEEEALKEEEIEKKEKKGTTKKVKEEKEEPVEVEESGEPDDDMILPSVSFKEIDVTEEVKEQKEEPKEEKEAEDEDDDEETKEQDLFNLIDTMYSKDGEE